MAIGRFALEHCEFRCTVQFISLVQHGTNETPGPDTITFDPTVFDPTDGMMDTIVLTEGQLTITDALTINGPGWDELTIDASGTDHGSHGSRRVTRVYVTGDLSRMNAAA